MASLISSTGLNSRNNKSNSRTILSVVVLFVCVSVVSGLYDDLGFLGVRVRPQRSSFRSSMLRTMFNKDRAKQDFYQPKVRVIFKFISWPICIRFFIFSRYLIVYY